MSDDWNREVAEQRMARLETRLGEAEDRARDLEQKLIKAQRESRYWEDETKATRQALEQKKNECDALVRQREAADQRAWVLAKRLDDVRAEREAL